MKSLKETIDGQSPSKVFILADHLTEQHCLPRLVKSGITYDEIIIVPSGEKHKSLETCEKIWKRLFGLKADRKSLLINLGGGVISDMGGFCASTYMRGMNFIQVPTTLLSQVDASIGGKLGVDFYGLKNSIGLFRDPLAVIADPVFLQTLPTRELRSGFAEVVKHGLIKDSSLWQEIIAAETWSAQNWEKVIINSLAVKKAVVEEDPFETGLRKILNFGHTIGHAIESVMIDMDRPILHGEAIAAGMIAEAFLSNKTGSLSDEDLKLISDYFTGIYGKLEMDSVSADKLIKKMQSDKKNRGAEINFTFLTKIGGSTFNQTANKEEIVESLSYYDSYQN
ncbi:UNVERIFIED_CONTAM: hypothetical protein GTU68_063549 [Idotea baltica]|nr:hypothetical protein [Idotea baltica]